MCAIFTPYYPSEHCTGRTWRLEPVTNGPRSVYSFTTVEMGIVSLSVGTTGLACTWELAAPTIYLAESVTIDHSGAVHCQAPPDFVLENVNMPFYPVDGYPEDCYGSITFIDSTEAKVPFHYLWRGISELSSVACGYCSQVCTVLCVKRGNLYESEYTRTNFILDEYSGQWNASDHSGEYITLHEEYGQCYYRLNNITPLTLEGDLVEITTCNIGQDMTVVDEVGDYIRISCNPCSCWDFLCGTLRCVCRELCVMGMVDSVLLQLSLAWDFENQRWGDDTFSVTPERDTYGNCMVRVTGYADAVAIVNNGGDEISFNVSEPLEDQLESGLINYITGFCKNCAADCNSGTCLDICDESPAIIYAEISPSPWKVFLGCSPDPGGCFTTITFPLGKRFVPTILNPAGEWRWYGCGIISCKNCLSPTLTNNMVCIDLGCDGLGTVTLMDANGNGGQWPISITIPCHSSEPLDETITVIDFVGAGGTCCDEGGIILQVTE